MTPLRDRIRNSGLAGASQAIEPEDVVALANRLSRETGRGIRRSAVRCPSEDGVQCAGACVLEARRAVCMAIVSSLDGYIRWYRVT